MAMEQTTVREKTTVSNPRRIRGWVTGAVAVVLVAASLAFVVGGNEAVQPDASASDSISREELTRDLVNRGLIPEQALEPAAVSREDLTRDLVNRGLIPKQALDGNG